MPRRDIPVLRRYLRDETGGGRMPSVFRGLHSERDRADRVSETAMQQTIGWVTEQGYKPVFYHEGFLGKPAN